MTERDEARPQSPAATVAGLRARIDETLRPLLPVTKPLALLDFPSFRNVGDSCIWLATVRYLRSLGVARLAYTSDSGTFSRAHLADVIGDGTILLSGGGNLGDLWPVHQPFREAVIAAFPHNRIIQLPQSIFFRDPAALARARGVFDRHPDFTLLVRDRRSLETARNEFRSPSVLCPDMTFALGAIARPCPPVRPVVWLARDDRESARRASPDAPPAGVERRDWPQDHRGPLFSLHRLARTLPFRSAALRPLRAPLSRLYEPLAAARVERGCRILSAAHAVVTDRLHAHVLCLLLGIPHFLLDNASGKNRSFFETWTRDCDLVRWCDDVDATLPVVAAMKSAT